MDRGGFGAGLPGTLVRRYASMVTVSSASRRFGTLAQAPCDVLCVAACRIVGFTTCLHSLELDSPLHSVRGGSGRCAGAVFQVVESDFDWGGLVSPTDWCTVDISL